MSEKKQMNEFEIDKTKKSKFFDVIFGIQNEDRKVASRIKILVTLTLIMIAVNLFVSEHDKTHPLLVFAKSSEDIRNYVFIFMILLIVSAIAIAKISEKIKFIFPILIAFVFCFITFKFSYDRANCVFDNKPSLKMTARIVSLHKAYRAFSHSLKIKIKDLDGEYYMTIPYKFYSQASVGDDIVLHVKPGYFDKKWVFRYENLKK